MADARAPESLGVRIWAEPVRVHRRCRRVEGAPRGRPALSVSSASRTPTRGVRQAKPLATSPASVSRSSSGLVARRGEVEASVPEGKGGRARWGCSAPARRRRCRGRRSGSCRRGRGGHGARRAAPPGGRSGTFRLSTVPAAASTRTGTEPPARRGGRVPGDGVLAPADRDGQAAHAEMGGGEGRPHRARVQGRAPDVGAVVDPRQHEVGTRRRTPPRRRGSPPAPAGRRCRRWGPVEAVDVVGLVVDAVARVDGPDGGPGTAVVDHRRDDDHVVAGATAALRPMRRFPGRGRRRRW